MTTNYNFIEHMMTPYNFSWKFWCFVLFSWPLDNIILIYIQAGRNNLSERGFTQHYGGRSGRYAYCCRNAQQQCSQSHKGSITVWRRP